MFFYLKVPALGLQPIVDKALRITGKTQHELPLSLQLIDGLNGLVNLKVMPTQRKWVKGQNRRMWVKNQSKLNRKLKAIKNKTNDHS